MRGWDKWIVVDLKFARDNEVRDWRKKGHSGRQPIWRGTKEDAKNLALLLNQDADANNDLVKKAERGQSEFVPWQNKPKRSASVVIPQFKVCESCGTRYKGEHRCDI